MVLITNRNIAIDVKTKAKYDNDHPYNDRGGCGCYEWVASPTAPAVGMEYQGSGVFSWPTTTTTSTTTTTVAGATTTVAGATTTVASSDPREDETSTNARTPIPVSPGSAQVDVAGAKVSVVETVDPDAGVATVTAGGVSASISGEQSEASSTTEDNNSLTFDAGDSVAIKVSGFAPDSDADVVIYSEPRQLGKLTVDSQGNISGEIQIPKDLESGNHSLVITGSDSEGNSISVKFGLIIFGNESRIPMWIWGVIASLIAILAILVIANLRSRRSPLAI